MPPNIWFSSSTAQILGEKQRGDRLLNHNPLP
jgi:hypothetical protein